MCDIQKMCKDCGVSSATKGPRCYPCYKRRNTERASISRKSMIAKLVAKNELILPTGRRICSRCLKKKHVNEFETSMPHRKGKLNSICDECLSRMYAHPNRLLSGFTYGFWRRRAYACNSTARNRIKREDRKREASLDELSYICKPQHLMDLFSEQKEQCYYCKLQLDHTSLEVDHNIPLCRDGLHDLSNLVLACKDCNRLKGIKTSNEFFQFIYEYTNRFTKQQN